MGLLQGANRVRKTEGIRGLLRAGRVVLTITANKLRSRDETYHTSEYGPTLLVDPTNYLEVKTALGYFERGLLGRFVSELDGATRFADVGANFGLYSLVFLWHAPETARVDAFEPLATNARRLVRNAEVNGFADRVSVHERALAADPGETTIRVNADKPGEATLGDEMWSASRSERKPVTVDTLDGVYEGRPDPDLVKIDVEGAEVAVVRGGERTLARSQPDIFLEKHDELLPGFGESPADLADALADSGYERVHDVRAERTLSVTEFRRDPGSVGRYLHVQA